MIRIRRMAPVANVANHLHDFHEFVFILHGTYRLGRTVSDMICQWVDQHSCQRVPSHRPIYEEGFTSFLIQWDKQDSQEFGIDVVGYPMIGFDETGMLKQNLQQMLAWANISSVPRKISPRCFAWYYDSIVEQNKAPSRQIARAHRWFGQNTC